MLSAQQDMGYVDPRRTAVVEEASSWLGTPYHHCGRVKGAGVDCATLLAEVYEKCGLVPHLEVPHYPLDWMLHRSVERLKDMVERVARPVALALPGDLLLWRLGRLYSHGAIFLGGIRIVHVTMTSGCVLGQTTEPRLADHHRLCYSVIP